MEMFLKEKSVCKDFEKRLICCEGLTSEIFSGGLTALGPDPPGIWLEGAHRYIFSQFNVGSIRLKVHSDQMLMYRARLLQLM